MAETMRARADRGFKALDDHLAEGHTWLAGDTFTVADIMTAFPLTTMRQFVPLDLAPYPNILAYLQRLAARPAFQRAMAKADPDLVLKLD
jgi:glutathione S-transferase